MRLARLAQFDPDSDVRAAAAQALGKIGTAEAIDALIETLHDRHASVAHAAARALPRLTSQPFSLRHETWHEYWAENRSRYKRK